MSKRSIGVEADQFRQEKVAKADQDIGQMISRRTLVILADLVRSFKVAAAEIELAPSWNVSKLHLDPDCT